MADDKVYTPEEIEESPFPQEVVDVIPVEDDISNKDSHSPATIKGAGFPQRVIAQETISQSLNTKSRKILNEFQFTESGALQIGKFLQAISGDIKISPDGLIARNKEGNITIAIDGQTGDVTLQGTLQSGSVITGDIIVKDGGRIQIGSDQGDTLIDEFGLVSESNFPSSSAVEGALNQFFTVSADVTSSDLIFTLPRSANVLFIAYTSVRVINSSGNTMDFQISLNLDGSTLDLIDYLSVDLGDNRTQGSSLQVLQNVSEGTHTLKLRGIVTNKIGSPQALVYRFRLSYLILGR